jgi:zinc transport system ATP-binding protein
MALLTARNLCVGYDRQIVARDINFTVNKGDYLCVVGENGSGKSTLMKTLLRLQKPVSGEIIMGDGLKESDIGYLPQQTVVQKDFPASVREIVLSGCLSRMGRIPFYGKKEKALADENMEKLGITQMAGKCYRELSGGQQQRVLLARALCSAGKMLILDEPVTGLDPKVTLEMYEVIKGLNKDGITIVMISHDINAAVGYSDHILHIGDKVFFGTREEFQKSKTGRFFMMMQSRDHGDAPAMAFPGYKSMSPKTDVISDFGADAEEVTEETEVSDEGKDGDQNA